MSINFEEEYKTIKKQYDSLLQKNQNDVIKIKQRQKALSEELQKLKQQRSQTEANHLKIIEGLKLELQRQKQADIKGKLTVQVASRNQERINELEMDAINELQKDARRLIDQNINLTAQNKSNKEDLHRYEQISQNQKEQIQKLKEYIASLEKDAKTIKITAAARHDNGSQTELQVVPEASFNALKEKLQKLQDQFTRVQNAGKELKSRFRASEDENKQLSQRQKKSMALLRRKQTQIASIQAELDKAKVSLRGKKKSTQNNESSCVKCSEYEQEIHLLKQMVKSTKGMVRVKQIQAEKYKIHNEEVALRDNKSVGRIYQKNLLPPLKKKHAQ